jgi:hypothetical protein
LVVKLVQSTGVDSRPEGAAAVCTDLDRATWLFGVRASIEPGANRRVEQVLEAATGATLLVPEPFCDVGL